jgi:hypothetical protein
MLRESGDTNERGRVDLKRKWKRKRKRARVNGEKAGRRTSEARYP